MRKVTRELYGITITAEMLVDDETHCVVPIVRKGKEFFADEDWLQEILFGVVEGEFLLMDFPFALGLIVGDGDQARMSKIWRADRLSVDVNYFS